jgi:hypothetical protein
MEQFRAYRRMPPEITLSPATMAPCVAPQVSFLADQSLAGARIQLEADGDRLSTRGAFDVLRHLTLVLPDERRQYVR